MKRFWLILLSLGLITAFSTSAFAADVKFSGEFYAAGVYLDKTSLRKDTADEGPSTAFYFQRLRVRTDFIVTPGLTLVTRFDALERVWGGPRSSASTTLAADSAGTGAENENIAFDWAYINYKSPIGTFDVGYMNDGSTGTIFGNSYAPAGRIKYSYTIAPFTINLAYTKVLEKSHTAVASSSYADNDNNKYGIEGVYSWKDGKAGIQVNYYDYRQNRPSNYKAVYYLFTPYAMAKIGPVALQAEVNYAYGKINDYETPSINEDIKLRELTGWLDATATFGPVYFGGTFAYVSGNDPTTANKQEGGTLSGGRDWNPCLILFGYYETYRWVGAIRGYDNTATGDANNAMKNAFFYQGRIGVRPISDLDIMASLSYAKADEKPTGYLEDDYGIEMDVVATYKITNNLSYMLGAGYLWTGDYFKYDNAANKISDNFMVINKLTLTF
ncbi:MAG: hypothetical protein A2W27_08705 [Deltaproteobacteria bacterium RBG_16_44_11]|nr:MAG: hypothetical protein A2W27_08705 [Deltaproteobacteria bacterium RBG_16_44_11]